MGWPKNSENKVEPKAEKSNSKGQASWKIMRKSITSVGAFKSTVKSKSRKSLRDLEGTNEGTKEGAKRGAKEKEGRCKNFPCCFYIPLEIAMELFGMLDVVFSTLAAVVCGIFLTLEPFAGLDHRVKLNNTLGLNRLLSLERMLHDGGRGLDLDQDDRDIHTHSGKQSNIGIDYDEAFSETSTTLGPVLFDPEKYDYELMARNFSRIASNFQANLQEVDNGCGRDYLRGFLFTHQLTLTNKLFEELIYTLIAAYILYALFGGLLLVALCCFRGYTLTKLVVILLWSSQLLPSYLIIKAAILSQSHRLCFLQYGIGKSIRGQNVIAHMLMWPLVTYKPYELFIWANFIRRFFQNKEGKLLDESIFSKEKDFDLRRNRGRTTSGTDLTKHHYSHTVGRGDKLFREHKSKSTNHQQAHLPWKARMGGGEHHSRSSSDEDV